MSSSRIFIHTPVVPKISVLLENRNFEFREDYIFHQISLHVCCFVMSSEYVYLQDVHPMTLKLSKPIIEHKEHDQGLLSGYDCLLLGHSG